MATLFTVRRFVVAGNSMEPTFCPGDYLLIDRLTRRLGSPARGDVVVLHDPVTSGRDYLKRIVGLPGEEVRWEAGRVLINGRPLHEPYASPPAFSALEEGFAWELGEDEYVVLGDNRADSWDSRRFGPVPREFLVGVAWIRYWPRPRWAMLRR